MWGPLNISTAWSCDVASTRAYAVLASSKGSAVSAVRRTFRYSGPLATNAEPRAPAQEPQRSTKALLSSGVMVSRLRPSPHR